MKEEWRKVDGYDYYEVSNFGRVRSLDKKMETERSNQYASYTETRVKKGQIRKPSDNGNGYLTLPLKHLGDQEMVYVHRLVAQAFIPNPENKPCVNHLDCDKKNNHVDNLEWCTDAENKKHAWDNGLYTAENHISRAKLTENEVLQIRSVYDQGIANTMELAEAYDMHDSTICQIVNRKSWKHL